jgi:hypothetical protein
VKTSAFVRFEWIENGGIAFAKKFTSGRFALLKQRLKKFCADAKCSVVFYGEIA